MARILGSTAVLVLLVASQAAGMMLHKMRLVNSVTQHCHWACRLHDGSPPSTAGLAQTYQADMIHLL